MRQRRTSKDSSIINWSQQLAYCLALAMTMLVTTILQTKGGSMVLVIAALTGLFLAISLLNLLLPKKLEWATLLLILFFGGASALLTPVNDAPDEYVHFARAVYVSEGDVNLTDNNEDLLVSEDVLRVEEAQRALLLDDRLEEKEHSDKEVAYPNIKGTNAYYSLSYLPQSAGFALGRLLDLPLKQTYYLGRLFNLLAYTLLVVMAIKQAKAFGQVVAAVSLLPMVVYLAGSYNQDGFSFGLLFLVVSLFARMLQEEEVSPLRLLAYYLLCACLVLTKFPYLLLVLLPSFLPNRLFAQGKWQSFAWRFLGVLFVFGTAAGWYSLYSQISTPYVADFLKQVNPGQQVHSILGKPIRYGIVLMREVFTKLIEPNGIFQYGPLSYGTMSLYALYAIYLFLITLNNTGKVTSKWWTKFGMMLVILGISGATVLALYLSWTPVGAEQVLGVQGRYFIGLFPLIILMGLGNKVFEPAKDILTTKAMLSIASLFLTTLLLSTFFEYYPF